MTCTHEETREVWVADTTDRWGDPVPGHWKTETRSLEEDIDLHRFKCTRCGEIGYYSGAARRVYEGGATADDYNRIRPR